MRIRYSVGLVVAEQTTTRLIDFFSIDFSYRTAIGQYLKVVFHFTMNYKV